MNLKSENSNPFNIIVIVAALGYFVDIYDLLLFLVERKDSLKEINRNMNKIFFEVVFISEIKFQLVI